MNRRQFLAASITAATAASAGCTSITRQPYGGIIDTHTHFYDPNRPQGVPWPGKDDSVLYRTVLPAEYRRLAQPLGVTGTVVVEASPWLADNDWILELAAHDSFLCGLIGNLRPGEPGFDVQLRRLARNPLFRGIRIGGGTARAALETPAVADDLRRLADMDLCVDVLGGPDELPVFARLASHIPRLRVVIDHCGNLRIDGGPPPQGWVDAIRRCAQCPHAFMKVSALVEGTGRTGGAAPRDPAFYRPVLDTLWEAFGADRVIYGSNWPVSTRFASYATVQAIVEDDTRRRGPGAGRRFFRDNAARAYKFVHRAAA